MIQGGAGGLGSSGGKSINIPIVAGWEKKGSDEGEMCIVVVASIVPCPGVIEDVGLAKDVV